MTPSNHGRQLPGPSTMTTSNSYPSAAMTPSNHGPSTMTTSNSYPRGYPRPSVLDYNANFAQPTSEENCIPFSQQNKSMNQSVLQQDESFVTKKDTNSQRGVLSEIWMKHGNDIENNNVYAYSAEQGQAEQNGHAIDNSIGDISNQDIFNGEFDNEIMEEAQNFLEETPTVHAQKINEDKRKKKPKRYLNGPRMKRRKETLIDGDDMKLKIKIKK